MTNSGNKLFPIFLKLDQIKTLIVGGGNVGIEKLEGLLKNDPDANITVVATEIRSEIRSLANVHPNISLLERPYADGDLEGIDLLVLATDNPQLHEAVRKKARSMNILVNVADTPHLCDFYLGSTVKKGDLKIGISTNGKSPTFAKRFREMLEEVLPDETDDLLQNLRVLRDRLKGGFSVKVKELNEITKSLVEKDAQVEKRGAITEKQ